MSVVILRTHSGADEVNARGVSYKVRWELSLCRLKT